METPSKEKPSIAKPIGVMLTMVAVAVLLAAIAPRPQPPHSRSATATLVSNLRNALKAYQIDYGAFPSGDYVQICRALFGDNPNKQKYFDTGQKGRNAAGEIVDYWGTPLRLDFSQHPHAPKVQSAGKNRAFEPMGKDSDDIYSWPE